MTVPVETSAVEYAGNDVTTAFSVPFAFLANTDLIVTLTTDGVDEEQTLITDYTVAGAGETSGTVTMVVAPPTDTTLRIERVVDLTQPVNLRTYGDFSPATHERALDRVTMGVQQVQRQVDELDDSVATDLSAIEANIAAMETSLDSALALLETLNENLDAAAGDIDVVALAATEITWTAGQSFEAGASVEGIDVGEALTSDATELVLAGGSLAGMDPWLNAPSAVKRGTLTLLFGGIVNSTGSPIAANSDLAQLPDLALKPGNSASVYFPIAVISSGGAYTGAALLVDDLGYIQCTAAIPDGSHISLDGLQWWNTTLT